MTRLLARMRAGDTGAMNDLFALVYDELRRRAHLHLVRVGRGGTLDTTALVHEAYLKLVDSAHQSYNDRIHFYAVASRAMRQILVDQARRRLTAKRGGGAVPVSLEAGKVGAPEPAEELVALDEALGRLATVDERLARTVELRFFGGLSVEETAAVLNVAPRTVKRDWQKARAVLHDEVQRLLGP
ncbi:MAG: sigma-70 family RNA polymerase sigma factor [Gemmatimonadales bacterium]